MYSNSLKSGIRIPFIHTSEKGDKLKSYEITNYILGIFCLLSICID